MTLVTNCVLSFVTIWVFVFTHKLSFELCRHFNFKVLSQLDFCFCFVTVWFFCFVTITFFLVLSKLEFLSFLTIWVRSQLEFLKYKKKNCYTFQVFEAEKVFLWRNDYLLNKSSNDKSFPVKQFFGVIFFLLWRRKFFSLLLLLSQLSLQSLLSQLSLLSLLSLLKKESAGWKSWETLACNRLLSKTRLGECLISYRLCGCTLYALLESLFFQTLAHKSHTYPH